MKLISSDGEEFEIEKEIIAKGSVTIANMLADIPEASAEISLPQVTGDILRQVVRFCKERPEENTGYWDAEFCDVDQGTLFDLILAADYLIMEEMLALPCKKAASMMKGKTPQDIRDMLGIENDFTPDEEEQIRKENDWYAEE